MSVSNTTVKSAYACNGVTVTFAIPFAWLLTSQIKVYVIEIATGIRTLQVLTTDYTYTPNPTAPTSIVMNIAPTADFTLEVARETSLTQLMDYINNGEFLAEDHEAALDKIVMMVQELSETQASAILLNAIDIVAGFEQTLPAATSLGIMRANADTDAFEFLTIEDILIEAGVIAQIEQAVADAAASATSAAAAQVSAAAAQVSAENAEDAADAAAASAAAAVGASVSNRIQVIPYAPTFMGALLEEEYDQEVYKFDIGNRVKAPAKMSAYFIPGAPIKLGFTGYSPTANSTSKYNVRVKATLVKDGEEVTSTVNEFTIDAETTVGAVVSAAKAFSFIISADGTINLVAVAANDLIILEITRIDASGNEDMNLLRLYKQTFELSFA